MWFHLELKGQEYNAARTALAVADQPAGPFTYIRSLRPNAGTWPVNVTEKDKTGTHLARDFSGGQMARDMTVFVDDDGTAYHIHAFQENTTLHISELTDDYQDFTGRWARVFPGDYNEAPALFKRNGRYYMISSGCSGWKPNAARSAVADSILGPWNALGNPSRGTPEQNKDHIQLPEHPRAAVARQQGRLHPHGGPMDPKERDRRPLHLAPARMGGRSPGHQVARYLGPFGFQPLSLVRKFFVCARVSFTD